MGIEPEPRGPAIYSKMFLMLIEIHMLRKLGILGGMEKYMVAVNELQVIIT